MSNREGLMIREDHGHHLILENGETLVLDSEAMEQEDSEYDFTNWGEEDE